jgi:hypothetical protein
MMGGMVALEFFRIAGFGAALLVLAAFVALVLWWREEGQRSRSRARSRARHTALSALAPPAAPSRREEAERVEMSA